MGTDGKGIIAYRSGVILRALLAAVAILMAPCAWAAESPNGVAVIIGNKTYQDRIPSVDYAHRDAQAIRRYVLDVLGYDPDNVIDLRDATKAQIEATFGNERGFKGNLWRYIDPDGNSDVTVFFSGHGVPGQSDGRGYILPVDAHPDQAEINGYPVDLLYKNLGKLKAHSVTVLIDACFSGDSPKGMLIRSASPVFLKAKGPIVSPKITVLTAASGSQLASWDENTKHGLFTEYFLRGVYGQADKDENGSITLKEIERFLKRHMTKAARREFGREQVPTILGNDGYVIAKWTPGKAFKRPKLSDDFSGAKNKAGLAPKGGSETEFWNAINNSKVPSDFEAYLAKFPNGNFAPIARLRLKHSQKYGALERSRIKEIEEKVLRLERKQDQRSSESSRSINFGRMATSPVSAPTLQQTRERKALERLQRQMEQGSTRGEQRKSLKEITGQ